MGKLLLFLLLCHSAGAVKHTIKFFYTVSDGVTQLPETVAVGLIDDFQVGHCDSNMTTVELTQTWMHTVLSNKSDHLSLYTDECFVHTPYFKAYIHSFKQLFNQTGGVHVLQRLSGCEWDDETKAVTGFNHYGYDGEKFLSLDLETLTWTAQKPQAVVIKQSWDAERERLLHNKNFFTKMCPELLKTYLNYGEKFLPRTVPPSVSVLQKTPSSPVSCHATGFYPHRALMFWTRDGEELHEDVNQGEILPNHDGTFQMSVDLDVSSVKAEDWRRYDCVFQLSGLKDDIITKLDKAHIRTNMEKSSNTTVIIISALVPVALVLIAVTFMIYKQRRGRLMIYTNFSL